LRTRKDRPAPARDPWLVTPADLLNTLVSDVLVANPASARVFLERRMGCVGCTFARFETVIDVAAVYGIDPDDLARALAAAPIAEPEEGVQP
jgi:hybrid cluster-associated redox disulfide protein